MTGFSNAVRKLVKERSGGCCEACSLREATQIHHRRPRGRLGPGDTNGAANAMHVCVWCHTWITTHETAARQRGWILPTNAHPQDVPCERHLLLQRLTDDGMVEIIPDGVY